MIFHRPPGKILQFIPFCGPWFLLPGLLNSIIIGVRVKMPFPSYPCRVAWFRTWFSLVPEVAKKRNATKSMQGGLVPDLVPLGSRGCRKAASHFPVAGRPPRKVHFSFKSLYKSCSFWGFRVGGPFRVAGRPPRKVHFSFKSLSL